MKVQGFKLAARVVIPVLLLAGVAAMAQSPTPSRFRGVMNAYTSQTVATTGTTGPYEVRGPWNLRVKPNSKADFYAALNMELSDGWVLTANSGNFDSAARGAHTHHVTLIDGVVTTISTGGISITGTATITLNGSPAPVSPSPITIEITGGTDVAFSNISVTFGVPGSNHFGTEALSGVVQGTKK